MDQDAQRLAKGPNPILLDRHHGWLASCPASWLADMRRRRLSQATYAYLRLRAHAHAHATNQKKEKVLRRTGDSAVS